GGLGERHTGKLRGGDQNGYSQWFEDGFHICSLQSKFSLIGCQTWKKLFHVEAGFLQLLHGQLGLRVRLEQYDNHVELLCA
ncbi:hypothetical protein, partial [Thiobacillus sp.]